MIAPFLLSFSLGLGYVGDWNYAGRTAATVTTAARAGSRPRRRGRRGRRGGEELPSASTAISNNNCRERVVDES